MTKRLTGAGFTRTINPMLRGLGSPLALIATLALGAASCSGDDGTESPGAGAGSSAGGAGGTGISSAGRGGTAVARGGRSSSGGSSDAGSPSGDDAGAGAVPAVGGTEAAGGSPASDECGVFLATKPCQGQGHCDWSNQAECQTGYCDCNDGAWACVAQQTDDCGGVCPMPEAAPCGSSCSGTASNCQCACGGPNYSGCSCVDGEWACLGCN